MPFITPVTALVLSGNNPTHLVGCFWSIKCSRKRASMLYSKLTAIQEPCWLFCTSVCAASQRAEWNAIVSFKSQRHLRPMMLSQSPNLCKHWSALNRKEISLRQQDWAQINSRGKDWSTRKDKLFFFFHLRMLYQIFFAGSFHPTKNILFRLNQFVYKKYTPILISLGLKWYFCSAKI